LVFQQLFTFFKARRFIWHIPKENIWQHSKESAYHLAFDTSSKEAEKVPFSNAHTGLVFSFQTFNYHYSDRGALSQK
jgi:hypothetical protein